MGISGTKERVSTMFLKMPTLHRGKDYAQSGVLQLHFKRIRANLSTKEVGEHDIGCNRISRIRLLEFIGPWTLDPPLKSP